MMQVHQPVALFFKEPVSNETEDGAGLKGALDETSIFGLESDDAGGEHGTRAERSAVS